jgi:hypothetical protein
VQLRLMLTRTENTFLELGGEALQDWRLGRGLR